jgi:hypothetical protein
MNIFRGDTFKFDFTSALEDGTLYKFEVGDIIKVGIKNKKTNSKCALFRKIEIEEPTDTLHIEFTHKEMKKCCEGDKLLEVELTRTNGDVITLYHEKITIVGDVINE